MFIFIRLYLAHCLGDFPFQTNHIFKLKQKGLRGVFLHVLIIVLCCLALAWPYLSNPLVLTFIGFIGITHVIQDHLKLRFSNPKSQFWLYLLDQACHVGIIALLFLTDIRNLPAPQGGPDLFVSLYRNDQLMIRTIILILTTYNGFFLMESFKTSFTGNLQRYDPFVKWYGMFERALIALSFLAGDHAFLFMALILLARPAVFAFFKDHLKSPGKLLATEEISLGWTIGMLGGLAMVICA